MFRFFWMLLLMIGRVNWTTLQDALVKSAFENGRKTHADKKEGFTPYLLCADEQLGHAWADGWSEGYMACAHQYQADYLNLLRGI